MNPEKPQNPPDTKKILKENENTPPNSTPIAPKDGGDSPQIEEIIKNVPSYNLKSLSPFPSHPTNEEFHTFIKFPKSQKLKAWDSEQYELKLSKELHRSTLNFYSGSSEDLSDTQHPSTVHSFKCDEDKKQTEYCNPLSKRYNLRNYQLETESPSEENLDVRQCLEIANCLEENQLDFESIGNYLEEQERLFNFYHNETVPDNLAASSKISNLCDWSLTEERWENDTCEKFSTKSLEFDSPINDPNKLLTTQFSTNDKLDITTNLELTDSQIDLDILSYNLVDQRPPSRRGKRPSARRGEQSPSRIHELSPSIIDEPSRRNEIPPFRNSERPSSRKGLFQDNQDYNLCNGIRPKDSEKINTYYMKGQTDSKSLRATCSDPILQCKNEDSYERYYSDLNVVNNFFEMRSNVTNDEDSKYCTQKPNNMSYNSANVPLHYTLGEMQFLGQNDSNNLSYPSISTVCNTIFEEESEEPDVSHSSTSFFGNTVIEETVDMLENKSKNIPSSNKNKH